MIEWRMAHANLLPSSEETQALTARDLRSTESSAGAEPVWIGRSCPACDAASLTSVACEHRLVYKIDVEKKGGPDGMTLDSEGRIWLALAKGGKVICVDPASQKEVHR